MSLYRSFAEGKPLIETNQALNVRYEVDDFDISGSVLEMMYIMDQAHFKISTEHMMVTHMSMKDENMEILEEGFKDFLKSAAQFFERIIKAFKDFMSKVFMYLQSYFGNFDKFMSKHKDKIMQANPDFDIKGYTYTFSDNVPNLSPIEDLITDYNAGLSGLNDRAREDVIKERDQYTNETYYSELRGKVLGNNKKIYRDEYLKDVHAIYRNGATGEADTIHVDRAVLNDAASKYSTYKNMLKSCKRDRDKTIILLENLKAFFNKSVSNHFEDDKTVLYAHRVSVRKDGHSLELGQHDSVEHSNATVNLYNTYYNFRWRQSKELSFMCVQAITEKVNALKACVKQYETTIRKSIFSVGKAEGDDK